MSGAATATAGRDTRPRHPARRAASSVTRHPRDPPVVVTSYMKFNADLPPLPKPSNLPRTRSAPRCGGRTRESRREGSATPSTSGVSSASSSPASRDPSPRPSSSSEGLATSSGASSPSASPDTRVVVEDEVTCAICLDLMHRPRRLPCDHTFCLLCLQNYANTCRTSFSCPTCRGDAKVPAGGLVALPSNSRLKRGANILRRRREKEPNTHTCTSCGTTEDVVPCGHCQYAWCEACGATHLRQVQSDITELRARLTSARDTLDCRAEEEETRLNKLEETIRETVEERVARLLEEGTNLTAQVQEMRKARQQQALTLSQELEQALAQHNPHPQQLQKAGDVHATLLRLLKQTSTDKGPRITLDHATLTLSTSSPANKGSQVTLSASSSASEVTEDHPHEARDEEEDDRQLPPQDHSLMYRRKGALARLSWGRHMGERPAGVAVSPWTSDIFVTGSDTCRVQVFDPSGRQLNSFGSRGHGDGKFLCPIGVAFSLVSQEVFITDKWKHCIHVFDTEGNFIRQLGRKGKGCGHFSAPEGITTDRHGNIYVADTCNHRVQVLDSDGVFLREFGVVSSETLQDGRRYTKTEFNEPTGVAVSLDGSRVYVADAGNHRIKVYDGSSGERVLMFGSRGRNKGQFETPECIAVDPEGFILVGDSGNGRVQVFRPNGNFIRYLGTRVNTHGEFGWVSGVALSRSLDVVVTDFKNNLVAVF